MSLTEVDRIHLLNVLQHSTYQTLCLRLSEFIENARVSMAIPSIQDEGACREFVMQQRIMRAQAQLVNDMANGAHALSRLLNANMTIDEE